MGKIKSLFDNKNAVAWMAMMAAIALHVLDETLTDFLPFYNNVVLTLRERWGFFPMPTFSYDLWLGGLIFAIALGFAFSFIVAKGGRLTRIVMTIVGVVMVVNALIHMLGSVYLGRLMPGFWSSPPLLAAALYVVYRSFRFGVPQLDSTRK